MDPAGLARLLLLIALVGAFLTMAELVDPERLGFGGSAAERDGAETKRHLAWLAAYFVVAPCVGWVAAAVLRFADRHAPLAAAVGHWPWVARVVLAVLVADGAAYWLHRAMHASPLLWRLHRVHHGATDVRWWTAFRFHPLDTLLAHTVPYTLAALAGVGLDAVALYVVAVMIVTLLAHADVYVPGTWVRRLVVTPTFHRRHHEVSGDSSNFALVLPAFDAAFRTGWFAVAAPRRFGVGTGAQEVGGGAFVPPLGSAVGGGLAAAHDGADGDQAEGHAGHDGDDDGPAG